MSHTVLCTVQGATVAGSVCHPTPCRMGMACRAGMVGLVARSNGFRRHNLGRGGKPEHSKEGGKVKRKVSQNIIMKKFAFFNIYIAEEGVCYTVLSHINAQRLTLSG